MKYKCTTCNKEYDTLEEENQCFIECNESLLKKSADEAIMKFRYQIQFNDMKTNKQTTITMILTVQDLENGAIGAIPGTHVKILARDRFIGVLDINKKDIYENDWVHLRREHPLYYMPMLVQMNYKYGHNQGQFTFGLDCLNPGAWHDGIEVIGNIHENPERPELPEEHK